MGILSKVLFFPFVRSKSSSDIITITASKKEDETRERNNSSSSTESHPSKKASSKTHAVTRSQAKRKSVSSLRALVNNRSHSPPPRTLTDSSLISDASDKNYTHYSPKKHHQDDQDDEVRNYIPHQFAGRDGTIDVSLKLINTNTTTILNEEAKMKMVRFS